MNKKLLSAAIGAALVAGPMLAAQAGVTVYGMAQVEVSGEDLDDSLQPFAGKGNRFDGFIVNAGRWNFGTNDDPASDNAVTVEDNARGRIGVKGSEDLGGGLKAIFRFEWKVDTTKGGQVTGNRESYVGLQGGWGTFQAGNVRSPYKYYGGVKYDPFVATNLEARRNGGMTGGTFGHNGFMSNSLGYISPKGKGPVQFWVVYSPDDQGGKGIGPGDNNLLVPPLDVNAAPDSGDYAAGVKVGSKSWEVFVATVKNKDNVDDLFDYTATKVGGMWKYGPHKIVAQYEDTSFDNAGAPDAEGNVLFVGYHLKFGGNNALVVQVGDGEVEFGGGFPDQEWTYTMVGLIHKFSKKTRVFAGYSVTDIDNFFADPTADGKRTVATIGLRKDF